MNKYIVKGTSRLIGSLGISTPFEIGLYANSREQAETQARECLGETREHVHVESVERVNTYRYLLVIQQDYGLGWEDVDEYECWKDRKEWRHDLAEYRLMGYPTRTVHRRVPNTEGV